MHIISNKIFRVGDHVADPEGNLGEVTSNDFSPLWDYEIRYDNGDTVLKTETQMKQFSNLNKSRNFNNLYSILNDKAA